MSTYTDQKNELRLPRFSDFKTPRLICLISANDGGSKLFQSYLDGHPQIYNIPAYPMLYFYPHWDTWKHEFAGSWNWKTIIDLFCTKHASVIDSRRIPGLSGLDRLGDNKNEHIEIDEGKFRAYLTNMLEGQPIERKTFLLAVHYAYALCNGEDISQKSIVLWHHHVYEYLAECMSDFPGAIMIGLVRDPRSKIHRIHDLLLKVDKVKLGGTDCMIYKAYTTYNLNRHVFDRMRELKAFNGKHEIYFVRHEDLALKLESVMRGVSNILGIKFTDSMLTTTFDGKPWWGHEIYNMPDTKGTYKRVLAKDWQTLHPKIEIFVLEGISFDLSAKYGYEPIYYKKDSYLYRLLLSLAILWPFRMEIRDAFFYLNPFSHFNFIRTAYHESKDKTNRKDYTQNAAYYYKWTYESFRLWKKGWYENLLDFVQLRSGGNSFMILPARLLYTACRYMLFWRMIFMLPVLAIKRYRIYYMTFWRRSSGNNFLPSLVKEAYET